MPWQEVANKSLTDVASAILPKALLYLFIIGGALGATATTLNGTMGYVTKPLIIACQDGWLPRRLGEVNKKTGTPIYFLTLFYIVGLVPIIFNFSLATAANLCTGIGMFTFALPPLSLCWLIKKSPELYQKSVFKLPRKIIVFLGILGFVISLVQGALLITGFDTPIIAAIFAYIAVAFIIGLVLEKRVPIKNDLKPYDAVTASEAEV